jgi:hypothetical protein
MSAYRRRRIASTTSTVLSVIAGLTLGLLRSGESFVEHLTPAEWILIFVPLALDIMVSAVLFTWARRRAEAEGALGYTTRTSGYTQYDQVNPRTGEVIRRAGSAVLTLPSATGTGAAENVDTPPDALRFTGKSPARRAAVALWIVGIVLVGAIAYISFGLGDDATTGVLVFGSVIGSIVVLIAVIAIPILAYFRGYLKSARQARPDAFLFLTTRTPELQSAAALAGLMLPASGYFAVTVSGFGLEFWRRKASADPITTLPWNSISRVQPGRLMVSNSNGRDFAAPTLHVFRSLDGELVDFPLPVFGPRSMSYASPDDANKVLDIVAQHARIA